MNSFASRFYVVQLIASSSQIFFTGQSPAQTVFSLQAKRIVTHLHSENVCLSACLIFEPVPYLHHGTASFFDLPGDHKKLVY
jgi:hypothetical protein